MKFYLQGFVLFSLLKIISALTDGEISALKDMQAEWPQLGWTGSPSCFWQGLLCNPKGNVIEMYMSQMNLKGSIPVSIGNFFALRVLEMNDNYLTGNIPSTIEKLTNLKSLSLSKNRLTNDIPTGLGYLTTLQVLDLAVNGLTGTIPINLGNLTNLNYLQLQTNQLTGTIPNSIANLRHLQNLQLTYNRLGGLIPSDLCNMNAVLMLFPTNGTYQCPIPTCCASGQCGSPFSCQ